MNARQQGFLLLTSRLGLPSRRVLTVPQLRTLAQRVTGATKPEGNKELSVEDLVALGYSRVEGQRIVSLLADTQQLAWYLSKAAGKDCFPITRADAAYPQRLRLLGLDCPGCLWFKGNPKILEMPAVALVGSRELLPNNAVFAAEAGRQVAKHGYVLISGNARGADRTAQDACLEAGGNVISIVADSLGKYPLRNNVLYISEESFDADFSSQRALSRNRLIHCLAELVLVAQCGCGKGGTWDGAVRNLQHGWSPVFCCQDGSTAVAELEEMGAVSITSEQLSKLDKLKEMRPLRFDQ